jgi:hypothetical protein
MTANAARTQNMCGRPKAGHAFPERLPLERGWFEPRLERNERSVIEKKDMKNPES